jgi:beta-lactamase superfamily II metal-dependent hydrolase
MAELRTPPTAADRVEAAAPGALELAALLPQAARIEPRLLRAVRIHVLPHRSAADEADLWSSDLVELRALDGMVLRADVQEWLRQRGRAALLKQGQRAPVQVLARRLHQANELLRQHHAQLPPLVQLEEEIAWLAMAEPTPEPMIRQKLEMALAALVRDGRVGVARWAARALPRLPEAARAMPTAWQLSVASRDRMPAGARVAPLAAPSGLRVVDLAALAPHLGRTPLGVRRIGDRLELGAVGPGGVALMVPASEPRFVTLLSSDLARGLECAVPKGERVEATVGWAPLTVRAADGQRWELPDLSQQERGWLEQASVGFDVGKRGHALGTVLAPNQAVTARVGKDVPTLVTPAGKRVPVQLLGTSTHGKDEDALSHVTLPRELPTVEPLPLAGSVAEDARVVSLGLARDGTRHPVVGVWSDDPDRGATVRARTRVEPEGCIGAPVVVEGQLAGVVTGVSVERSSVADGDTRSVRLRVAQRLQALDTSRKVDSSRKATARPAITVDLLPAGNGTAILIGWGPADDRRHLLLDGGPRRTAKQVIERVWRAIGRKGRLELLAVSHADANSVEGATDLLLAGVPADDIWFNGPMTMNRSAPAPTRAVAAFEQAAGHQGRLNGAFRGEAVAVLPSGPLPRVALPGGATLTVLGPDPRSLAAASEAWQRAAARRDVLPEESSMPAETPAAGSKTQAASPVRRLGGDRSVNNAASLVLLFEYQGHSVLLPGDAHAAPLTAALRRLAEERDRAGLYVDVFVLPHCGSRGNVTPELFDVLEAGTYAISTDGSNFHHPDPETIELIAQRRPGCTLVFNYRSEMTGRWANPRFQAQHRLQVVLPQGPGGGVELKVGELVGPSRGSPYK